LDTGGLTYARQKTLAAQSGAPKPILVTPMNDARRVVAAFVCAALCQTAQAQRSRLADDLDPIEAGDCALEAAYERQTERAAASERTWLLQFGCGLGWRTEAFVSVARQRSDGARDVVVGVEGKTMLVERNVGGVGLAIGYGLGSERIDRGRWRYNERFVELEATHRLDGGWSMAARLGTARDIIGRRNKTTWALSVERPFTESLEGQAELAGDDRARPVLTIAARYLVVADHAAVTLSYGAGTGSPHVRRLGLAIAFEF